MHQLVADADLDALDAALGELRAAGWPAPEDPDSGEDTELDGRDSIADRLSDEVSWLRECADWLAHLDADSYPPAVNLRPSADWPDRAIVAVDLARVAAVIDRIAADVDELARARRVQDLDTAAVLPDRRSERRGRLAEPDLEFRAFCARGGCPLPQPRSWSGPGMHGRPSDTSAARSANGPATSTTRSGPANDHPVLQRTPGLFRKLDAVAVLTARLLPVPPLELGADPHPGADLLGEDLVAGDAVRGEGVELGGRPSKPESGNGLVSGLLVSEDALDDFGVLV